MNNMDVLCTPSVQAINNNNCIPGVGFPALLSVSVHNFILNLISKDLEK